MTRKYYILFIIISFIFLLIFVNCETILGFNIYLGFGYISSTNYSLDNRFSIENFMIMFEGDSIFIGMIFNLSNTYSLGIEFNYLSRGLISTFDFYYLLFNGGMKLYLSIITFNSISNLLLFRAYFNIGAWASILLYSVYKSRIYSYILDVIDLNNFNPFNFGIYLGYNFRLKNIGFEVSLNLGFLDDNSNDSIYLLPAYCVVAVIYYI